MARTVVVCLLVAALECAAQQVGGTIRGTIVDERNGRGIGGAKLFALALAPRMSSTAEVADGADPETGTTIKGYSALGGIQRLRLQNGTMTQRWNYNDRGQTELLAMYQTPVSGSATTLMKLTLGYGTAAANNGNVRSQGITLGSFSATQAYEYDEWNRLKTAVEGSNWKQEFGYDRWGNRWIVPSGTSGVAIATTTATGPSWFSSGTNRLALAADATDAAGNQSPNGAWRNRFDAENRLTKVEDPSTTPAVVAGSYEYDGDGRRVKRTVGSVTTVYVYNAMGELMQEYGGTAAAAGRSYLFQDHLGSTRMRAASDGARQGWWDYTPFGEVLPGSAGNRSGVATGAYDGARPGPMFTGQEKDAESGLDNFGARYLSAVQGRFMSPDAPFVDQHPSDPQSWNLYAYVRNNPLTFVDPTGRCSKKPGSEQATDDPGEPCVGEGGTTITVSAEAPAVPYLWIPIVPLGAGQPVLDLPSQTPSYPPLTGSQCEAIRVVLEREAQYGTPAAARMSGNTFGDGTLEPFNSTFVPNLKTPIGELDLDWYTDMTGYSAGFQPIVYPVAKLTWSAIRATKGIEIGNGLPFSDRGEVTALKHSMGVSEGTSEGGYRGIFTRAYLRQVCGAK